MPKPPAQPARARKARSARQPLAIDMALQGGGSHGAFTWGVLVFLEALHTLGVAAAERWLQQHRADLGQRSTLDLRTTFLMPRGPRQG